MTPESESFLLRRLKIGGLPPDLPNEHVQYYLETIFNPITNIYLESVRSDPSSARARLHEIKEGYERRGHKLSRVSLAATASMVIVSNDLERIAHTTLARGRLDIFAALADGSCGIDITMGSVVAAERSLRESLDEQHIMSIHTAVEEQGRSITPDEVQAVLSRFRESEAELVRCFIQDPSGSTAVHHAVARFEHDAGAIVGIVPGIAIAGARFAAEYYDASYPLTP